MADTRRRAGRRGKSSLIRLAEKALQTEQYGLHVVGGSPLVLEDVKADAAGEVHVGVVDGRLEEHRGRRVGIVGGELEAELQAETRVRCVVGPLDGGHPQEQVAVRRGKGGHAGRGRGHELHELGL